MNQFQGRLDSIEALISNGELEEAHRLAQEMYRENPHSLDCLRLLVKVLYRQNKQQEATAYLKRANLIEVEYHTFFDNVSQDSIVLDLGGWEGNFTEFCHKRYDCEVHIVEPNIKYYEMEKRRFKGLDRVHVYNCAIGGETKLARFYPSPPEYPGKEKGSSLLAESPYVDSNVSYEVQVYSLYDFVQQAKLKKIDLIKMDIEGAEIEVFNDPDTQQVLSICQNMTIEFHHRMPILPNPFIEKSVVEGVIQRLEDSGFKFINFSRDIEFIDCLFYRERSLHESSTLRAQIKKGTDMKAKNSPLVSILIPTYNRASYLDECLYSVLAQDYTNCEIFIRDNDSTDNTLGIVKKYEPKFSHFTRFRYKKNETNVGERNNLVHGVAECRGKYTIILMDDDFLCSRTAISSMVQALEATEKTSLVVASTANYLQGQMELSPKEIIDRGSNRTSYASFSTVPGEEYFLNSWTKYGPLCLSAAMFDTQLLLKSPWAEWSRRAGLDVNIYHLLSLSQDVAVIKDALAFYRLHGGQDIRSFSVENSMDSHSHIMKWYEYAKRDSKISSASLFIWRLKTVILKDDGPIRWLHDRNSPQLDPFLRWLKNYNYLHYVVLRCFSPQMIRYDYEAAIKCSWLIRVFRKITIGIRSKTSNLILQFDRVLHDPEYRYQLRDLRIDRVLYDREYRFRFRRYITRRIFGSGKTSHE